MDFHRLEHRLYHPTPDKYKDPATHSCEIDQDTWENSPAHYVQLKEIKRGCTGLRYGLDQSVLFTSAIRTRTRDGEMSRPPFPISWAPIKAERQFKSTGEVGFTSDWRPGPSPRHRESVIFPWKSFQSPWRNESETEKTTTKSKLTRARTSPSQDRSNK